MPVFENVHAGYELHFAEMDLRVLRAVLKTVLTQNCDHATIDKIAKRAHYNDVGGDRSAAVDFITQHLLDLSRTKIGSAQIHIDQTTTSKDVRQWYDKASRHQGKSAYIKQLFVSFTKGIVAFLVCIDSRQVYVTMTNNSGLTLQGVKRLFNSAQKQNSEFIVNYDIHVPITTYIH